MKYENFDFSDDILKHIYRHLVFPRLIEEKMLIALRQGKIGKWFSGIGQEAIAVGSTLAMEKEEFILPLHRNLGVFTVRNVPLEKLFAQFLGKKEGFTKGRDRSFHFGTPEHHIVGMISHLGANLPVADGIALGMKLRKEKKVVLVFCGEGGTSEGDFHEAVNVASVWRLPVIFLIENNGYALSTPTNEQFRFEDFIPKGPAYGIQSKKIDGNNVLEVFSEVKSLAEKLREQPDCAILEATTFRMRGHEEASGIKYVPDHLLNEWSQRDPIQNFERYLLSRKIIEKQEMDNLKQDIRKHIDDSFKKAYSFSDVELDMEYELDDVFHSTKGIALKAESQFESEEIRFIDAIREAHLIALKKHPELIVMGQDIAEYGGAFKVTEGLIEEFGKDRIRNTPLCESAIVGIALGLSIVNFKSIVEMQFADFASCAFNQIVNNLAKSHYRWGQKTDVVIRMPTGGGTGAGPYHSQSMESWFFHTPGLKIVYPSNPQDAKGLLLSAIEDPNPVLFFEHKFLYRTCKAEVLSSEYHIEIGKAKLVKEGSDLTVITYGLAVHWMEEAVHSLPQNAVEIVDLRSLMPWDKELVLNSVKKTSKVLIIQEDNLTGSISAEISAYISEYAFEDLDAPVRRLGSLDTPVPFSKNLEDGYFPKNKIIHTIKELLAY